MDRIYEIFWGILNATWNVLLDASFFILLGFVIAALIRAFISSETIVRYMGGNDLKSVLRAALFGVPLPLCSCGVVPTAMALRKQGASKPATLSFLISTPESSIDSIALTYALIDPIMTVFRPIAAFITGFVSGAIEIVWGKKDETKNKEVACPHCVDHGQGPHSHSLGERIGHGLHFAFVELLTDISRWFLIGMVIAGIITFLVPTSIIENYLGAGFISLLIMLVVGLPLYVCAVASTPIAAALLLKGMDPGAALVFLLVGPATNAASFSVIVKMLGIRTAIIYVVSIAVCALVLGLLLNEIYAGFGINIQTHLGHAHQVIPDWLKWITAVPLTLVMLVAAFKKK
ncbi:MAG: SO_0444 family Cu/Zn efflux transporter [Pseudomonadota bacterium]